MASITASITVWITTYDTYLELSLTNYPRELLRATNLQLRSSHLFICIPFLSSSRNKTSASPKSLGTSSQAVVQHDFFGDNHVHSMLPSVLVSAPFTTEFSGVTPSPGSNKRLRTDSPSPDAILVEEPKKLTAAPTASPVAGGALLLLFSHLPRSARAPHVS
jgi:hypothetical protein